MCTKVLPHHPLNALYDILHLLVRYIQANREAYTYLEEMLVHAIDTDNHFKTFPDARNGFHGIIAIYRLLVHRLPDLI